MFVEPGGGLPSPLDRPKEKGYRPSKKKQKWKYAAVEQVPSGSNWVRTVMDSGQAQKYFYDYCNSSTHPEY